MSAVCWRRHPKREKNVVVRSLPREEVGRTEPISSFLQVATDTVISVCLYDGLCLSVCLSVHNEKIHRIFCGLSVSLACCCGFVRLSFFSKKKHSLVVLDFRRSSLFLVLAFWVCCGGFGFLFVSPPVFPYFLNVMFRLSSATTIAVTRRKTTTATTTTAVTSALRCLAAATTTGRVGTGWCLSSSSLSSPSPMTSLGSVGCSLFSTVPTTPSPPTSNHRHDPISNPQGSIIYTETDEAPALATFSLYPVISKVCNVYILCIYIIYTPICLVSNTMYGYAHGTAVFVSHHDPPSHIIYEGKKKRGMGMWSFSSTSFGREVCVVATLYRSLSYPYTLLFLKREK